MLTLFDGFIYDAAALFSLFHVIFSFAAARRRRCRFRRRRHFAADTLSFAIAAFMPKIFRHYASLTLFAYFSPILPPAAFDISSCRLQLASRRHFRLADFISRQMPPIFQPLSEPRRFTPRRRPPIRFRPPSMPPPFLRRCRRQRRVLFSYAAGRAAIFHAASPPLFTIRVIAIGRDTSAAMLSELSALRRVPAAAPFFSPPPRRREAPPFRRLPPAHFHFADIFDASDTFADVEIRRH